jgi:tRNA-splicing ligase RtcB (3'-phosphate/5'-hydroxy nucleic acid ligase)
MTKPPVTTDQSSDRASSRATDRSFTGPLEPVDDCTWRIPKSYKPGMLVDGLIFADERLIPLLRSDRAPEQVANVAFLPGIQQASLAMPDIHWGYGFCIGGVCATDPASGGVVSPGGVGYDINCGVRLVRTNLTLADVKPVLTQLVNQMIRDIPVGVGQGGNFVFSPDELRTLMREGVPFLARQGLASADDIACTEAEGCIPGACPEYVSDRALARGADQCGTVGAGNHFIEVQVVDRVENDTVAAAFGLHAGQICVLIHSGSRGLGYQVCDDALRALRDAPAKYGFDLPDRQLVCAPVESPEGKHYLGGMRAAANYAFCNRQLLMWHVRQVFARIFGRSWEALDMQLLYDVAHNMAKIEEHAVGEARKDVCVHRKGATRAFPAGHHDIPERYRHIGQPVIIPGDMGRASWVLVGGPRSLERSFGTTCHGAGRCLSRTAATKAAKGRNIRDELLKESGVVARCRSREGLAEEQPAAYKDVDVVVDVVHRAGLSLKVARLRPLGVIKG